MKVQELLDFLEIVSPNPEADVKVLVEGKSRKPRISYSGGNLVLEVPQPRKKKTTKR